MIRISRERCLGWHSVAFAAWLIVYSGCGGGGGSPAGSTSNEEATVHGKVTIKGVPAKEGRIYFDPTNVSRQSAPVASAEIAKDGTYRVKTLLGENRVNVETPETRRDPNLSTPEPFAVQSGDNTFNVTLPHPSR